CHPNEAIDSCANEFLTSTSPTPLEFFRWVTPSKQNRAIEQYKTTYNQALKSGTNHDVLSTITFDSSSIITEENENDENHSNEDEINEP
ncbi:6758_t:CDS:2, partial [Funneliformis geosporum]